ANLRVVVAEGHGAVAGEEVEVLAPLRVPERRAEAAGEVATVAEQAERVGEDGVDVIGVELSHVRGGRGRESADQGPAVAHDACSLRFWAAMLAKVCTEKSLRICIARRPGWMRSRASGMSSRRRTRPTSEITPPGANSSSDMSPRAARSISPRVIWILKV